MKNVKFIFLALVLSLIACEKEDVGPIIDYPDSGYYGENILRESDTDIKALRDIHAPESDWSYYSISADIPSDKFLKVLITRDDSLGSFYWNSDSRVGWSLTFSKVNEISLKAEGQVYADMLILFSGIGESKISIYEADVLVREKMISW